MRLEPTGRAVHLLWVGMGLVGLGVIQVESFTLSVGAALLIGVAFSRALCRISIARARSAGFEMLWLTEARALRAHRLGPLTLQVELRNRDLRPMRFRHLTVTHAPALDVDVHPEEGEIPAGGALTVTLRVLPHRVGYHGIHGLTLRSVHAPGLFTVPLTFASPVVLEVLPRGTRIQLPHARGGRSDGTASDARISQRSGEGTEFRELREHRMGDSFKRVAWKASARRGKLLVVDQEHEQRDNIWILVDASLESAAGAPGQAPLDRAIDDSAQLADRHLKQGDRVGLLLVGGGELARVPLGRGAQHRAAILQALSFQTHTADLYRSDWDDLDVAQRVLDHARHLATGAQTIEPTDRAALLALARPILARAPVQSPLPLGRDDPDQLLRQYLLSFGIQPPPRYSAEQFATERELGRALSELAIEKAKQRPSLVHLFARPTGFDTAPELTAAFAQLPRQRIQLRYHKLDQLPPLSPNAHWKARIVRDALGARLDINEERAQRQWRRQGLHLPREHTRSSPR